MEVALALKLVHLPLLTSLGSCPVVVGRMGQARGPGSTPHRSRRTLPDTDPASYRQLTKETPVCKHFSDLVVEILRQCHARRPGLAALRQVNGLSVRSQFFHSWQEEIYRNAQDVIKVRHVE